MDEQLAVCEPRSNQGLEKCHDDSKRAFLTEQQYGHRSRFKTGTGIKKYEYSETQLGKLVVKKDNDLGAAIKEPGAPYRLDLSMESTADFSLILSNDRNQSVTIGFNAKEKKYFIDRSKSGDASFYPGFDSKYEAPRMTDAKALSLTLVVDHSSVELFADNGMTVMTGIFFAGQPYNHLHILFSGGDRDFVGGRSPCCEAYGLDFLNLNQSLKMKLSKFCFPLLLLPIMIACSETVFAQGDGEPC